MASSDSASIGASPECRAIRRHFASLAVAITDPLGLSMELFSLEIIEEITMEKAKLPNQTDRERNSVILSAVMKRVEARPSLFHDFVDLLKENGDHIVRELGKKLETTYGEYCEQATLDSKGQLSSAKKQHSPPQPTEQVEHPLTAQIYSSSPPTRAHSDALPTLQTEQVTFSLTLPKKQIDSQPPQSTIDPPPPQSAIDSPPPQPTIDSPPPLPAKAAAYLPLPPTEHVDYSLPSHATHPMLLSLQPQSPVRQYAEYLRAFYQTSELPANDKWPPSPSEIFINLTVISREKISRSDLIEIMLASVHGNVDQIIEIKAPIEIGKLLCSQPAGKTLQCVLVEGAPGVGKSTLAWEVSKQWGKGVSNQHFAIVMLLQLRDQTVQNAQNISDLIFYHHSQGEISQYLDGIKGRNILIIFEGLDELPAHLLTHSSVFSRLLSGKLLPHTTILVTSRPSATEYLWNNCKHRISRHIEVLGFTHENITQYITSILSSKDLSGFQHYLSINPHVRTMMYIPLHAAIITEVYKMCQDYSKTLPTTITELYTCFVQTVLLRYITSQPDYKGEQVNLDNFTDLPPPIYDLFYKLTQVAYSGVINQQFIFKQHKIKHLGFMKAVRELFPNKLAVTYSYNFLHLSIQEYLASYYVSTLEISQQEQLLQKMCSEAHLKNMGLFLAGITRFTGMDKVVVSKTIEQECKSTVRLYWEELIDEEAVQLSIHALHLLYESGNASILDGNQLYGCPLSNHSPLFDFSTLGYCITHSNCKWELHLGTFTEPMKSPEGIETLVQALKSYSSIYCIKRFILRYGAPECVQQLQEMPENVLRQLQTLGLIGNRYNHQPLPHWMPELLHLISNLQSLVLDYITGATAVHKTVQAVISINTLKELQLTDCDIDYGCVTTLYQWLRISSKLEALNISLPSTKAIELISTALITNSTIKILSLRGSRFSLPAMQAMCSMLARNSTITVVMLQKCHIDDDIICCLTKDLLNNNNTMNTLNISHNSISERGAVCVAEMLKINDTLKKVDLSVNPIGLRGQLALKTIEETTNKLIILDYSELNDFKEFCSKCKQM